MKRLLRRLSEVALLAWAVGAPPANAAGAEFIEFDPEGSVATFPVGNNLWGEIAGYYNDAVGGSHGFVRAPGGAITTFDPPDSIYTVVYGLNLEGATTGAYVDENGAVHGFNRTAQGAYVSLDAPDGAGGTQSYSINQFGEALGNYYDSNGLSHGFLRSAEGTVTEFDAPGADQGTFIGSLSLNAEGASTGDYHVTDTSSNPPFKSHGFIRSPLGKFTSFDAPQAGDTFVFSINDEGAVTGIWVTAHGGVEHGYLRSPDGQFSSFEAPGAGSGTGSNQQGTLPASINGRGEVTGYYIDANNVNHGFVRECGKQIVTFDAPGAGSIPTQNPYPPGTFPVSNNLWGEITGYVVDAEGVPHGFLRK